MFNENNIYNMFSKGNNMFSKSKSFIDDLLSKMFKSDINNDMNDNNLSHNNNIENNKMFNTDGLYGLYLCVSIICLN